MKLKPIKKKCNCGRKVLNHHYLCDKCYSERDKINLKIKSINSLMKDLEKRRKLLKKQLLSYKR